VGSNIFEHFNLRESDIRHDSPAVNVVISKNDIMSL